MKILYGFVIILFFAVTIFAQDVEMDNHQEAFNKIAKVMKRGVFSQDSTQAGKDGISVACTIMPSEEIVSVAWKIENPDNKTLTIKSQDMRLYSTSKEFKLTGADSAIDVLDDWNVDSDAVNDSQETREDLQGSPGQESKEEVMRESAFRFGDNSGIVVSGVTYFVCRLKDLSNVTAEIKVDGQDFKFSFDGGGP
ncbi:MAG: hypothetical protein NTZ92_00210 [Candidatus Omnitrophica bacterium]|nr:hypothetical protein [Candidatus Omnitrophota bacterium]